MPAPNPSAPRPRLYLGAPAPLDPAPFADALAAALDAGDVACLRLTAPEGASEDALKRAVAALAPVCQARDVALLIADYYRLVPETALDGVHFTSGRGAIREARALLGPDKIIGVGCGASRHQGLTAGELGADYVSFGPVAAPEALRTGALAEPELFAWWQSMIELPVVAEGGMTPEIAGELVGSADFVLADRSVWAHPEGPAAGARAYAAAIDRGVARRAAVPD